MILLHLPNYAVHKGSSTTQASLLISVSGITELIGRIITGIAANHEKMKKMTVLSSIQDPWASFHLQHFCSRYSLMRLVGRYFMQQFSGCFSVVVMW